MNPSLPDETELLRSAQGGEALAFGRMVELYAEPVWRCARGLCGDDHEAQDLAQETFVEAWRSLQRFDGRARFSTWLYGILRHRFLKSRRKSRPVIEGDGETIERPSREAAPSVAAEQAEEARLVHAALALLPNEHRAVLEMRFFADASLAEIATLLGCPLGTVKSRLHHGLENFAVVIMT
ncbi:MAG: sigma-70 family RNA polymerase sigma factor [Planctomycetaceae bacterium]